MNKYILLDLTTLLDIIPLDSIAYHATHSLKLRTIINHNFKHQVEKNFLTIDGIFSYTIRCIDPHYNQLNFDCAISVTVQFPYLRQTCYGPPFHYREATINNTSCHRTPKQVEYQLRCIHLAMDVANYLNVYFDIYKIKESRKPQSFVHSPT
jgi:hypothetical protein